MKLLSIETSTKKLSLAVSQDEKILKFRNTQLQRPLSSSIMPSINNILSAAGISLTQLDGFAIGLGPGSFTGLRVGLSTVKGLAFATSKPVVGISSLDILAMNIQGDSDQICTICDAKRKLVYACLYSKEGPVLKRKSDYVLANILDVLKPMKGMTTFIGDGVELFKEDIEKAKNITPTFVDGKLKYPQARYLTPLALQRFQKGKPDDIDRLIPLYLYPDDCQIKK